MTIARAAAWLSITLFLSACAPRPAPTIELPVNATVPSAATIHPTPSLMSTATPQPTYAIVTPQYFTVAQLDEYSITREPLTPAPWSTGVPGSKCPVVDLDAMEAQAGFRIRQPTALPEDYHLTCALYHVQAQGVLLFYTRQTGSLPQIAIYEFAGSYGKPEWPGLSLEDVGASALIYPVQIGNAPGEYVNGHWLYFPSATGITAKWSASSPTERLRWEQDGLRFEINVFLDTLTHVFGAPALVVWAASVR